MPEPTLPDTRRQRLTWFDARIQDWIDNQDLLQLTPAQASELFGLIQLAKNQLAELESLRAEAKGKTQLFYAAVDNMVNKGRLAIKEIRLTAEETGNTDIYGIAQIPPPAEPRQLKQPAAPTGVNGVINDDGTVTIKWAIPSRGAWDGKVYFQILREMQQPAAGGSAGPEQLIGTSHDRDFTDYNVPAGFRKASYRVIARRNGFSSNGSAPGVVTFGQPPNGVSIATGNEGLAEAA